ncbi:hypothetical protein [Nodularia chucula]|uniref:hypothetical protein n=1 Tax=Nodularia chucula TaxID=3093667 RepID=UPI0039C5B371
MSLFVAKKLVIYRSAMVALIIAGITWVILIIAPLELFSVSYLDLPKREERKAG